MNRFCVFLVLLASSLAACAGVPGPEAASGLRAVSERGLPPPKTLAIGSFNAARGGIESLGASEVMGLHAAIHKMFHAKFRYAAKLTPTFLRRINVVAIGVAFSISGEITPLSVKEQRALIKFAKGGGAVIIFADNSDFQKADDSLLQPF